MSAPASLYLTQYGLMAQKHWREYCPRSVAHLETAGTLMEALWEAIAIVLAVSFLSLGFRTGLVVALSIPLVLAMTYAAMYYFGIDLQFDHFDFSSWEYCEKHGKYMPDDWKEQVGGHDAIFFGAVGWPEKIADQSSI